MLLSPVAALLAGALAGAVATALALRRGARRRERVDLAGGILETLPDGAALVRLDGRVRRGNAALARLLGVPPRELPGLELTQRLSGLPGDLAEEVRERQCELRTPTGRSVPVSVSTSVLRDAGGRAVGLALVARDLGEVVSLRDRLTLSGRLAAVGELAAGIAHEINNPLAFVRANLGVLRIHWEALGSELTKRGTAGPLEEVLAEGEELIEESLEGVERGAAIVRDVRLLAHGGPGAREVADLNGLLESVVRMAQPQLRGRAAVEKQFGESCQLDCAPHELLQVFLNLVVNAGQAIPDRGTIRLVTRPGPAWVEVRVEDDGCGIEPEHLERIFEPFFTTKPLGEGTGLGLGIAYEIVRRHGGEIRVDSEVGRGTTFLVRLPRGGIH